MILLLVSLLSAELSAAKARAAPLPYSRPSLNPSGIESAFIAAQGDYYAYAAGFVYESPLYTNGSYDSSDIQWISDGSMGVGFGLGSSTRALAVQLGYNIPSFRAPDSGGTLDLKVSRDLVNNDSLRVALGVGVLGVLSYGEVADKGSTPFLVSTVAFPVLVGGERRTMQVNAGYGGGKFRESNSPDLLEQGLFASVGVEFTENFGVSVGWSGRGLNASFSVSPWRGIPLTVGASLNNLANHDQLGRAAVLSLAWGGSFQTASF